MKKLEFRFKRAAVLPVILQDERTECGHACVAMIGNYFGHDLDLYHIRTITQSSQLGVNLGNLKQTCEQLGLRSRALRVGLDELALVKTPAILHWNMNHFVVLKSVKKTYIVIHDPACGLRRVYFAEVSKSFTGVVLEIEKANDFQSVRARNQLKLSDLVNAIKGLHVFLIALLLLSLSIEMLSLLNPLFLQYVTDDVIATADLNNLYVIAIAFVVLLCMQVFIEYIRGHMVIYLTNHLTEQFSSNVMGHLLKLPLAFFEKRHKGDIQSKFQSIEYIQQKIGADFVTVVLDGLFILLNLAVILIYSRILSSLVIGALFFYMATRYASYQFLKRHTETSIVQHAKAASIFLETLQGIIPIKSFLKESSRLNTWRNAYIHALNADIVVSKMQVIYHIANQFLFQGEHIIVMSVGATLVLSHQLSLGMLMAFLSYRMLLVNKASSLIQSLFNYRLISIQLGRLGDVVGHEPEAVSHVVSQQGPILGALTLKNISFEYGKEQAILQNINIAIQPGEKVAIIGPSGCGKSTLLKVMMGLLQKTSGEIYIDERSLSAFGLKNYRELTAAVMQDDALLSGSVLDNIAFFAEDIDIERVYASAELACIHETITLFPMGYETLVGDMGSVLSGGQKQRILLARALYKQPHFLFLDEATSHLDADNEMKINQSLKSLNITQIIIAHREETIRMADRVINLAGLKQPQMG